MSASADLSSMIRQSEFELFGFPASFQLDLQTLEARYLELAAQTHPDRHLSKGEDAQQLAENVTRRLNRAYESLRHPLKRAELLLDRLMPSFDRASVKDMPQEFLAEMLELNERLEETLESADVSRIEALQSDVEKDLGHEIDQVSHAVDSLQREKTESAAADLARQINVLRYLFNILEKIKQRQD